MGIKWLVYVEARRRGMLVNLKRIFATLAYYFETVFTMTVLGWYMSFSEF